MFKRTLTALALFLLAAAAQAGVLTETIDRTFDAHPGAALMLSNVNGRVLVRAWDQPKIKVHAVKSAEGSDDAQSKTALRKLTIDFVPDDGGLRVIGHFPQKDFSLFDLFGSMRTELSIDYEIDVPRQMNVNLATVNGTVQINAIEGALKVATTNGRINGERLAGSIDAETTNGSVHLQLLRLAGNDPVRIETTNGAIELTIPRTTAARVDAHTTNGAVTSALPVTTQGHGHEGSSLAGTINGGGPLLRLRTTNGGITIRAN